MNIRLVQHTGAGDLDPLPENPIERLMCIARQARDSRLATWLMAGIVRHIESGESLDRALGLAGTLGRSPRFDYLRRERDSHLAQALARLDGDFAALAAEIDCFERRVWPSWRYRAEPDPAWSPARQAIHAAFRVGMRVPTTADGLKKTLTAD